MGTHINESCELSVDYIKPSSYKTEQSISVFYDGYGSERGLSQSPPYNNKANVSPMWPIYDTLFLFYTDTLPATFSSTQFSSRLLTNFVPLDSGKH